jgi:uncharacterized membrane protein YgcG
VRVDGTVIILHSGNHELVCLRHRDSQTLYVSDVIEPPTCANPGYGKLHVGIYLAAIQDTMDRHKQLHASLLPKPPSDDDDPNGGDKDDEDQNDSDTGHDGGHGHRGGSRAGGSRGGGSRGGGSRVSGARKKSKFQGGVGRKDADVDELVAIEVRLSEPCKSPDYHGH